MTTHFKPIAILCLGVVILATFLFKHSNFIHDDTFITLRYAVNFAQTGLPQWNPGEWVEGYSSLLHVTVLAGLISIGLDPVWAVHLTNGAAVLALLALTIHATGLIAPSHWPARLLTTTTVATAPPLALWLLGGLETPVVAAFLLAGLTCLIAYTRTPNQSLILLTAIAFSGAILTRLDSAVFITGAGLGLLLAHKSRLIPAMAVVAIPASVAFIQMAIRLSVYGEAFPLTFYAKTDLSTLFRLQNGALYIAESLPYLPVLAIALVALAIARTRRAITPTATLLTCPILLHLAYVLWAGGDHMPAGRNAADPARAARLAAVLNRNPTAQIHGARAAAHRGCRIASVCHPQTRPTHGRRGFCRRSRWQTHRQNLAPEPDHRAQHRRHDTLLRPAKTVCFIDMLGLNDPIIAKRSDTPMLTEVQNWPGHTKGDGAYVLSRKPDRIIAGPAEGRDIALSWFLSGAEMNQMPEFHQCYEKRVEHIPYNAEIAAKGPPRPNPLQFTYYQRVLRLTQLAKQHAPIPRLDRGIACSPIPSRKRLPGQAG